jgi:RNA polymerase sigma-70 factor (ECF subfamily)
MDEELVQRSLLGDLDAFDELVRRFRGSVLFVAEQVLGSADAAEDVAQEACLLAVKALSRLREPEKFPGWLAAIARHRARRVAAQERRAEPTEPGRLDQLLANHCEALAPDALDALCRQSERTLVRTLLAQLPPDNQTVLYLRYFEEWPIRRIAGFLSLSVTTVQWRLHHGRNLLRRQLTAEREEHHEERTRPRPWRDPADLPPAPPDGGDGPGGQHDGKPGAGCRTRRAAV